MGLIRWLTRVFLMAKAPPSYPYYPDSFEQGTATMTLSEVGAYQRLLNHQWACGSVPGDHLRQIAGILRCTPSTAKSVWAVVKAKFDRGDDGAWRNARMETERRKQAEFRETQIKRGKIGAEKRWRNDSQTIAGAMAQASPKQWPDDSPKPNDSFPSPSSSPTERSGIGTPPPISTPSARSSPLIVGPLQWAQKAEKFSFFGSRLRVPHVLHDELRNKLGGENPHERLCAWYLEVNEEAESKRLPIPDVFDFLRPLFKAWAHAQIANDAERQFLEGA